ncbi:hypothetical protein WR25_03852 [Diploscapter pachys]|uniref:Uncharacterized protein n=1 Tax=Diploscapter pachys TaxID=2018661 RepID=A0A2A2JN63_9BILA|nr:hypothetical protein WR25_03852 [Diploscapter pachys]
MVYIGIDLGTTCSCVSVIEDGRPVSILSDDGKFTIPSAVAYCDTEILVGNPALTAITDISNVLYGQENERFLRPEEVSAEILKKLKTTAERYLSEKEVTGAVVTVPAFFNNDQIDATKRAIQMAGLDLKYLLEEPTAAAIAYYNKMKITDSTIMVFDWGGGTLDISIAEIKNGKLDVKSVCSDAHLGGQDFDERIMKYVIEEIKKSLNYDISQQPNLMKQLRRECKEAKESLSSQMESCSVKILVGGSTRIPKIQELLSHKFGQTRLRYDANPEVVVAHGAAIIADALEKGIEVPLINNTMNELFQNINNSHKVLFYCPDPPGWREDASVGYFKNKLYYLGGYDPETREAMNRIDILIDGEWQTGPAFPLPISGVQTITCDGILYGHIIAYSLLSGVLKSCLCFDPSAPVDSRISRIADMNHARYNHSLIVANGKLYAIGGFRKPYWETFCNSTEEEYNPQTNEWRKITITVTDPTRNNPFVKTITSEANQNPNIRDAIAIDIGTSKCKIAICKEKYIQIVEHEANRSVPSYVALSEQGEWLVGKMAENYAICLQNVIYDIRWLLGKTNGEINRVQDEKRYFFKRSENLPDNVNHIVVAMSSATATQNQPEVIPSIDIPVELIDEPIAVAAAYATRLNIHPKGDVALVFCMGAGYLQVAAYFIQQKAQQEVAFM